MIFHVPTYVIACDELPERKAAAAAHLSQRGIRFKFWRGIHGRTWGLRTVREYEPCKTISAGHVGLNLGHWTLWNHLAYLPKVYGDTYLVLEDDAVLPAGWAEQWRCLTDELAVANPDWGLCMVGLAECEPQCWSKVTERLGGPDSRLCRMSDPFGTHAYVVRHSALAPMIDHMTAAERNMDQQLFQRVLQPGHVNWCAVLPTLVRQRTFDHDKTGRTEWAPSCIEADEAPHPSPAASSTPLTGRESAAPESGPDIRAGADRLRAAAGVVPGGRSGGMEINHQAMDRAVAAARTGVWPGGEQIGGADPDELRAVFALTDPYACIYRGELFEEIAMADTGRSVPLWQCARLNQPCHTRHGTPGLDVSDVVACSTCKYRSEMAPDGARPRLPVPDGHFNPSIAMWGGRLILATRDSWGHSRVALWELTNAAADWTGEWAARAIGSYAANHPDAPRLEDPRLFVATHDGRPYLHSVFSLPDGYPPKLVQVGYVRFAEDLSGIEATVVYPSPHGNAYEKNWVPFEDNRGRLQWVYATKPDHVVLSPVPGGGPMFQRVSRNPLPWTGGVIRGGAAPVLVGGGGCGRRSDEPFSVYYHFFHGCLKRPQGSIYTVGCAVFEAAPPFRVLRQTATPLLWPDLPAAGEDVVKRYVIWPGGAVPHAGAWHLALGIDDTNSRITRIPFAAVEAALNDVPESGPGVTSIRSTEIATGVKR